VPDVGRGEPGDEQEKEQQRGDNWEKVARALGDVSESADQHRDHAPSRFERPTVKLPVGGATRNMGGVLRPLDG
jgi:hypothetical protein